MVYTQMVMRDDGLEFDNSLGIAWLVCAMIPTGHA